MTNRFYHLAVCRDHAPALEFTRSYKMPKHWRESKSLYYPNNRPACQKDNCYKDAELWLGIDLREVLPEVIEKGQSRLASLSVRTDPK